MSEKATSDGLCPVCGTPGPEGGESFCDVCGTLIDWDVPRTPQPVSGSASSPATHEAGPDREPDASGADPVAAGSPSGVAPTPSPSAGGSRSGAGGKPPMAAGEATEGEESRPGRRSGSPAGPKPEAGSEPDQKEGESGGGEPVTVGDPERVRPDVDNGDGGRQRARALLVPVPDAEGAEAGVPAVLPGLPVPARPTVRALQADEESGITCPRCGVENRLDRAFCRNDGIPLDGRTNQRGQDPGLRRQRLAGWRPRIPWKRVLTIAGIVSAVIGAALLTPLVIRTVNDHFSDPAPLPPAAVSASNADAAHPAQAAFDGVSNSWWGTGYSGDSAGQYLQANYGRPVKLEKMIITPGVSRQVEDRSQARPERLDVLLTDARGRTALMHYALADGGVQVVDAHMDDVVQVDMIVRSAYGTAENKQVAIAEVEMFGRS